MVWIYGTMLFINFFTWQTIALAQNDMTSIAPRRIAKPPREALTATIDSRRQEIRNSWATPLPTGSDWPCSLINESSPTSLPPDRKSVRLPSVTPKDSGNVPRDATEEIGWPCDSKRSTKEVRFGDALTEFGLASRIDDSLTTANEESQESPISLSGFFGFPSPADVLAPVKNASLVDRSVCPSIPWDHADDFSPTPMPVDPWFHDSCTEQSVYDDKHAVPTQRPLIEWGRNWYGSGITPPSETWLGDTNLVQQQLYLYGDFRTGMASGRNAVSTFDNWASRLNLDLDYRLTGTERFHAFFGPLNRATEFTRFELNNGEFEYLSFYNLNPVTAFFEGDAGALLGGAMGTPSAFELPITAGLVPLLFQNGIWMEDAVSGAAFAIPARHSRLLNWANFDATFFAVFDQLNSPAFPGDANAAQAFGTAWFIDAYDGYIETGYAYLNDRVSSDRSYHNSTISFTRRYFDKISNSVRVIVNSGQDLRKAERTADGVLLLIENSLVTAEPFTFVPYFNLFAGWDRPQSVARAGVSGGILRNTGLNFEIDGLNGYPTLDSTGADTAGGSVGVDLIGSNFDRQWVVEATYLTPHGDRAFVKGNEYALGTRYQIALSHRTILRFDAMYGWRENDRDLSGTRIEYRWKF